MKQVFIYSIYTQHAVFFCDLDFGCVDVSKNITFNISFTWSNRESKIVAKFDWQHPGNWEELESGLPVRTKSILFRTLRLNKQWLLGYFKTIFLKVLVYFRTDFFHNIGLFLALEHYVTYHSHPSPKQPKQIRFK